MKYVSFKSRVGKPTVVMFSAELSHVDVAKMVGMEVLGAGFATLLAREVHVAGISVSLLKGPADLDAAAIKADLDLTAAQFPPPPLSLAVDMLTPAEQAAWHGTKAPERCYHCGQHVTHDTAGGHNGHGYLCLSCDQVYAERVVRAGHLTQSN